MFEFDLVSGDLWKGSRRVKLQNKPRQVLRILVERPGELVTREEFHRHLWTDDTFVDFENGLNVAVRKIREALGDLAPSPRFVETERGRGYRFIAPITDAEETHGVHALEPAVGLRREHGLSPGFDAVPASAAAGILGAHRRSLWWAAVVSAVVLMIAAIGILSRSLVNPGDGRPAYTQITNFTDSAIAPALSPDGRMVAFIRGDSGFLSPDQIWVKPLPNGEPVQLTNMPGTKYGPSFSLDGSRVAFTLAGLGQGWRTFTVPLLGGDPRLMLSNAAGLTWMGPDRVLFSEIRTGLHMGIVTATENRSEHREVYFPQHERAMAHYSYASPDRKWALVVQMNHEADWEPCRVIALDGSSSSWQVGPRTKCTSTAWSPDGKWMYFSAGVVGDSHLWRQRFPKGAPEQITFGPEEQSGVAMFPDGRSLITAIGIWQSALWIHDTRGERAITSEGHTSSSAQGYSSTPSFCSDGKHLYYLLRRESPTSSSELWRFDVESGKSEGVITGFSIVEYHIARNESEVVFSTQRPGEQSQLWLAPLDRRSPPRQLAAAGEGSPHFGVNGEILFLLTEGTANYLGRMNNDGSRRGKVVPYPIGTIQTVSPDGEWVVAISRSPTVISAAASVAVPVAGGAPRQICPANCEVLWAPDGQFLYVTVAPPSRTNAGKTVAIPLSRGTMLPGLPTGGIRWPEHAATFPHAHVIEQGRLAPALDPATFAYVKTTVHRNLFQIPLR